MFRKLRNKFMIMNMALTSLVMIMAFGAVYFTTYNNIKIENEKKLDMLTGSLVMADTAVTRPFPAAEAAKREINGVAHAGGQIGIPGVTRMMSEFSPSFVIITDGDGNIVDINSSVYMQDGFYTQALKTAWDKNKRTIKNTNNISDINNTAVNHTASISGRQWLYRVSTVNVVRITGGFPYGNNLRTYIEPMENRYQISFLEITDTQKTLRGLLITIIFVLMGLLAVIFIISFIFANRSIKPISESWEKQKKFVADASHELKTPLSTIMANYDVLNANENETVGNQREWLDYIKIGIDRMNKLVSNLLTLAKSENINIQTCKMPFNIDKLIDEVICSIHSTEAAQSKKLKINKKIGFTEDINGYEEQVRQIFTIIYENAVKYSCENGEIDIEVKRVKKSVACSVRNTGQGIAPKDLPHIFDRFYRADTSRTGESNSYGLGLAIAKSISSQIGGKITVQSVENEWAKFTLIFDAV